MGGIARIRIFVSRGSLSAASNVCDPETGCPRDPARSNALIREVLGRAPSSRFVSSPWPCLALFGENSWSARLFSSQVCE